jgi:hypothetical protein
MSLLCENILALSSELLQHVQSLLASNVLVRVFFFLKENNLLPITKRTRGFSGYPRSWVTRADKDNTD